MNLTKKIKADLVHALVAKAASRQYPDTLGTAQRLQQFFRASVFSAARAYIPELSANRVKELIQDGVLVSHSQGIRGLGIERAEGEAVDLLRALHTEPVSRNDWRETVKLVEQGWPSISTFLWTDLHRGHTPYVGWKLVFHDLPYFPEACTLYDEKSPGKPINPEWNKQALELSKHAQKLCELYLKVLVEAHQYKKMLEEIFLGINTTKQLEDKFPEALEFLPKKAPVGNKQVASVELINRARKMLETGIPD